MVWHQSLPFVCAQVVGALCLAPKSEASALPDMRHQMIHHSALKRVPRNAFRYRIVKKYLPLKNRSLSLERFHCEFDLHSFMTYSNVTNQLYQS